MKTTKTAKPKTKTVQKAKTSTVKRKAGRPKGSKNKPKTVSVETNDRLSAVFDHNGVAEPKSVPRPLTNDAVVVSGGVVIAAPTHDPAQVKPLDLPKPKPAFDGQTIVMTTTPEALPDPGGESVKSELRNDNGVLLVQEPARSN